MPIGYSSGSRMARSTAQISNHNQCGGPTKQGLVPSHGFFRTGMTNLKIWKDCGKCSRLNTRVQYKLCGNIPRTMRPTTSGGVGGRGLRFK